MRVVAGEGTERVFGVTGRSRLRVKFTRPKTADRPDETIRRRRRRQWPHATESDALESGFFFIHLILTFPSDRVRNDLIRYRRDDSDVVSRCSTHDYHRVVTDDRRCRCRRAPIRRHPPPRCSPRCGTRPRRRRRRRW